MLFRKFLCLFYLIVFCNCNTISKSIATHDHLNQVVDSINDYETSSARNGGRITHEHLKQPRYHSDDSLEPNLKSVTDKTKEIIKKILSNISIPINDSDPGILLANRDLYPEEDTLQHGDSETITFNPVSEHTGRKSNKNTKSKQIKMKNSFWRQIKNKFLNNNIKTTKLLPDMTTKIATRKKKRFVHKKKYKHKKHSNKEKKNRKHIIPVTHLEPSFFDYKTDNPLYTTDISSKKTLFLHKDATEKSSYVSHNKRDVNRSFKKLLRKIKISPTTLKTSTVERISDPGLNNSAVETLLNKLKSNAFDFMWDEITGVPDITDSVTESNNLNRNNFSNMKGSKLLSSKNDIITKSVTENSFPISRNPKEVRFKEGLKPRSSKELNTITYITEPIPKYEHRVKSRTILETFMANAPGVIECQIKHELNFIKSKIDDLEKDLKCKAKCEAHDFIKKTANEMRELACKIEDLDKNIGCKPLTTKCPDSKDNIQIDNNKNEDNVKLVHDFTEIPAQQQQNLATRFFLHNNLKDSATISDDNSSKNQNDAVISTAPSSKAKEAAISDKLFTTLTNIKVPGITDFCVTMTTPSNTLTNSEKKLSEQNMSPNSTKGWHFTLPFTQEDFSILRVLEDLLNNQPKTTTDVSDQNVININDTTQKLNKDKRMSEYEKKRDAGYKKRVAQPDHSDIPESLLIHKTQDANSLLDLHDLGISANGVESWFKEHFLIKHSSDHSKRKFHTAQTVTLRSNAKMGTNNNEAETAPKAFVAANEDLKGRSKRRKRREMRVRTRKRKTNRRHRHRKRRDMTVTYSDTESPLTPSSLATHTRRQRDVSLAPRYQEKPRQDHLADAIGITEIFSQTWIKNDEIIANIEETQRSNELNKTKTEPKDTRTKPPLVTMELVTKGKDTVTSKKQKNKTFKLSQDTAATLMDDEPSNKQDYLDFPEAPKDVNVEEQVIKKLLLKLGQKLQDKEGMRNRALDSSSKERDKKVKNELKGKEEKTNATKNDTKCRRRINWNWFKNLNKNSRTCNCKFIPNKPMSKVCAASDAVITELISELENMGRFMSDHCTEIQTFFWMNPSGGKKLRELVNKINKNLDAYYRRTKGSCKGLPCSSFKKKRDLDITNK